MIFKYFILVFTLPLNGVVEFSEISKRTRREVVTLGGQKICPVRYCEESEHDQSSQCRQNDDGTWEWHSYSSPLTTICNTVKGVGGQCEVNGQQVSLPHCWYDQGTMRSGDVWREDNVEWRNREIPVFIHMDSSDMFCMPCCAYKRARTLTMDDIAAVRRPRSEREIQIKEANTNIQKMPSE